MILEGFSSIVWKESPGRDLPPSDLKFFPDRRGDELHLAAFDGNVIVADAELQQSPYDSEEYWLKHISVRPGYERQGFARRLAKWAFAKTESLGGARLVVSSYSEEGEKLDPMLKALAAETSLDVRFNTTLDEAMRREEAGMGLHTLYSDAQDLALAGGFRTGSSPAGMMRIGYQIIDLPTFKETRDQEAAQYGTVEVFVGEGDDIKAMVNIKLDKKKRKAGMGRRVVAAVQENCANDLVINDIQRHALGFWKAVGCSFYTTGGQPLTITQARASKGLIYGVIHKGEASLVGLPFFRLPK